MAISLTTNICVAILLIRSRTACSSRPSLWRGDTSGSRLRSCSAIPAACCPSSPCTHDAVDRWNAKGGSFSKSCQKLGHISIWILTACNPCCKTTRKMSRNYPMFLSVSFNFPYFPQISHAFPVSTPTQTWKTRFTYSAAFLSFDKTQPLQKNSHSTNPNKNAKWKYKSMNLTITLYHQKA